MAQFDIFQIRGGVVVDCQTDVLRRMPTRFIIPLEPITQSLIINDQLNPRFMLDDQELVLVTQLAGTVRARELAHRVGSLTDEPDQRAVQLAIDMLTTGV